MKNNYERYCFGRLNLIANFEDKRSFIFDGLNSGKILAESSLWGFFGIREFNFPDIGTFAIGYLVKYKNESEYEVAVPAEHELQSVSIEKVVVAKSRFFLHIKTGIIAFHPLPQQIDYDQFRSKFVKIFTLSYDNLFVSAEIQAIQQRFKLLEYIRQFTPLKKIEIKLHPSNPNNSKRWQRFDGRMKAENVKEYYETFVSDRNGFNTSIADDHEITDKIVMAEDGYGKATISGMIGDRSKKISTSDNPLTVEIQDNDNPEIMMQQIKPQLDDINNRFEKE